MKKHDLKKLALLGMAAAATFVAGQATAELNTESSNTILAHGCAGGCGNKQPPVNGGNQPAPQPTDDQVPGTGHSCSSANPQPQGGSCNSVKKNNGRYACDCSGSSEDEENFFASESSDDEDNFFASESSNDEENFFASESSDDEDNFFASESSDDEDNFFASESSDDKGSDEA